MFMTATKVGTGVGEGQVKVLESFLPFLGYLIQNFPAACKPLFSRVLIKLIVSIFA